MGAEQVDVCKVLVAIFLFYFIGMWLFALWVGFTSYNKEADADDAFIIMIWPLSIILILCMDICEWIEKMKMKKSSIYMVLNGFIFVLTLPFRPLYIGGWLRSVLQKRK